MRRMLRLDDVQRVMAATSSPIRLLIPIILLGIAGLPIGLAGDDPPPTEDQERTDLHGDPLPTGAAARLGTLRFRPAGPALSISFHPTEDLLASNPSDGEVSLWDATTGKETLSFPGPEAGVRRVVFASARPVLAVEGGLTSVGLRDLDGGESRTIHEEDGHWLSAIAISSDGRTLATATTGVDDRIRIGIWDATTGKRSRSLEGPQAEVYALAFSPDGETIACGGAGATIRIWEVASGEEVLKIPDLGDEVVAIEFSPDGKSLAWAVEGHEREELRLWDLETGKVKVDLEEGGVAANSISFSPDGRTLAAGCKDAAIRLWDAASGKRVLVVETGRDDVYSVDFSPDGKRIASSAYDDKIRIWDASTGREIFPDDGHVGPIGQVVFSPDGGTLASSGTDGRVRLWDVASAKRLLDLDGHENPFSPIAFAPDGGMLALGMLDATIRFVETATGKETGRIDEKGRARRIRYSPDGRHLATASRYSVRLWDLASRERTVLYHDKVGRIPWIDFASEGGALYMHCISGSHQRRIVGWEIPSGKEILSLPRGERAVVAAFVQPGPRTISVFKTADGIELFFQSEDGPFARLEGALEVTFSPDGRRMATVHGDGIIRVSEVATGDGIFRFEGHRGSVSCLAFSRDGSRLASGGADSTILIWDLSPPDRAGDASGKEAGKEDISEAWALLADEGDALRALGAIRTLVAAGKEAVEFLRGAILDPERGSAGRIERLIAELDHDDYDVRERAHGELLGMGRAVEGALRRILEDPPSPEVRIRAMAILEAIVNDEPVDRTLPPEVLRRIRAIEVLERIGGESAEGILAGMAEGQYSDRVQAEARAALSRLRMRGGSP